MPQHSLLKIHLKMKDTITSETEYQLTMEQIFALMNKGEQALSEFELTNLSAMAMAAEQYEKDMITPS
jgi:hypothetical protein